MPLVGRQTERDLAYLEFWSSVNPYPARRTDYAHHITA